MNEFLLEFTFASEKTKEAIRSVSGLDGQIQTATNEFKELSDAAEKARKAFEGFVKSQDVTPSTPESSGATSAAASSSSDFVSLTGKNGETISVDPKTLGYDGNNIKGSREDGSSFSTSNLDEESKKKAQELIATRFGMGGSAGTTTNDGYVFIGNGQNRDPRIDQDVANSRMTGDTYEAFKAQQRNQITDIPELQRIRSMRAQQLFEPRGENDNRKIEEIKKIIDSLDKRIAEAKKAEIEQFQAGGVAMAEAFATSVGGVVTPEFEATLKQLIDVRGSVVIKDGVKTAEEILGLDAAILKVIEEHYNKKQKEKDDKLTKENGGTPVPSITPR